MYLDNTNLVYNLAKENQNTENFRETFFLNQLRVEHQVSPPPPLGDFKIDTIDFEVGGKSKGLRQIKNAEKGFVVKDK